MLPASNPQLCRWYSRYREQYFGDRLPPPHCVSLRFEHPEEDQDGCVMEDSEGAGLFHVQIDPALRAFKSLAKIVLLHEMAHVSIWPIRKHGKGFKQVLERLWEAGAYRGLL